MTGRVEGWAAFPPQLWRQEGALTGVSPRRRSIVCGPEGRCAEPCCFLFWEAWRSLEFELRVSSTLTREQSPRLLTEEGKATGRCLSLSGGLTLESRPFPDLTVVFRFPGLQRSTL